MLCEREIARKDHRRIDMALKLAHFPVVKELAGFDFEAQPSIDRKQIRDLAGSRGIANGDNVLLLGRRQDAPPHARPGGDSGWLLGAVPHRRGARRRPRQGTCREAARREAARPLESEVADRRRARPAPLTGRRASFFQLVSRRYETGAMLITSNRSVAEWATVFADPVPATAILDRLLRHSHVLTIRGDSYRLRAKRKSGLVIDQGAAQR